jgi:outer membrane protein TolC
MKTHFKILIISFAFAFGRASGQQDEQAMSLKQSVQYALKENTDIKKQNLAILRSRYQVQETTSHLFPQLSATGQFTDNLKLQEQLLPGEIFGQPGTFIPVEFGVQYSIPLNAKWNQVLYDKAYFTAIQQSKTAEQLSMVQQENVQEDVIYNVASSYYQSIIIREQQKIIEANLANLTQSVNVAQVKYDNQMIRKIDLDQLKVNKTNTQAALDNSVESYSRSLDLLKIIMGYPINDTLILTSDVEIKNFSPPVNSVMDNPLLSIYDKQLELKHLDIKGINANYYPTLSGFAQYGYQTQFNNFTSEEMKWTSSSVIGASVSIPIFDGLLKKRQVQQRNLELKAISLDKQLTENQLNAQYQNAVRKYKQTEKTADNQKINYDLAQSVYEAIQANYNNGLASLSDLINSDSSLKDAQTQYLTALLQKGIAALDILKANGNMNDLLTY